MRVINPVSASRVGSGNDVHDGAPGAGRAGVFGNSSSCGHGGRRGGRGMAISLMAIAKAYPSASRGLTARCAPCLRLRKKGAQRTERGGRRHRTLGAAHRLARRRVQHPQRQLLGPAWRRRLKGTARASPIATLQNLMDVNPQTKPGVPAIGHDRIRHRAGAVPRFVGLPATSCIISSGHTRLTAA